MRRRRHSRTARKEFAVSGCADEFRASADEDGTGHVYEYLNTYGADPNCTREACTTGSVQDEWPIHSAGESEPGTGHVWVTFCLQEEPNATKVYCELEVEIVEEGASHHLIYADDSGPCPSGAAGVTAEIDGAWELEGNPIEILHE